MPVLQFCVSSLWFVSEKEQAQEESDHYFGDIFNMITALLPASQPTFKTEL